jgi:drug/metabolite transporter (DMT)-like permease
MPLTPNARGILTMCAGMAAFTFNDACMKAATQTLPLMQAIAIRGVLAVALLLAFARFAGGLRLPDARRDRGLLALRTLAEVGATLTFLGALVHMPLANISAIMQALPLAITLTAALVFGEAIGWRRLTAIAVGFAGVLLIVRPGTEGFDRWSVLGLLSVCFVVVRDLSTRRMSGGLSTATVALGSAVAVAAMGFVGMVPGGGWQPVTGLNAALLALAAGALFGGYLFSVAAMRVGDVAAVAPFRYTALLWAILFGWIGFGTLPDALTLAGAALVVATGLFTLWRERQLRRRR